MQARSSGCQLCVRIKATAIRTDLVAETATRDRTSVGAFGDLLDDCGNRDNRPREH